MTRTEFVKQDIPASLLACDDRPAVPVAPVTDQKVGRYIVGLLSAHDDCKGKLDAVRGLAVRDEP
ncbi:hypothetical protein [Thalassospira sp. MCCC 1A01428]|uniref:hypothetical protein n=1 Tax=Thalassospira sp. MCCC 1A01428 TaxID=1470575 RepID=UPI00111BF0B3|nr:hypothetical protein [Thalassospira sp. MCCC 1A01428]